MISKVLCVRGFNSREIYGKDNFIWCLFNSVNLNDKLVGIHSNVFVQPYCYTELAC